MKKIFFDASVLFVALYSQTGGSHALCMLVKKKLIVGITSQTVINEILDNAGKLPQNIPDRVEFFVADCGFVIRNEITDQEIAPFLNRVDAKDAHVVAGAILTQCDYLVTLDQKHLNNEQIKEKITGCTIISPRTLLEVLTQQWSNSSK